jgi:hypothetical protein
MKDNPTDIVVSANSEFLETILSRRLSQQQ